MRYVLMAERSNFDEDDNIKLLVVRDTREEVEADREEIISRLQMIRRGERRLGSAIDIIGHDIPFYIDLSWDFEIVEVPSELSFPELRT